MSERVGILTGGGDAPGLNAVIRAAVWRGVERYGFEMFGILDGWRGILNQSAKPLSIEDVRDIIAEGGTILGTSRTNPNKNEQSRRKAMEGYKALGLDALVVLGGDDTIGGGYAMSQEGMRIVGVPKTIDNDLSGTDVTFGFDTAINRAVEAIDRLRTTARSHGRVMVVELMGRHAGWIALEAGIAGGADIVLLPEKPFRFDELVKKLKKLREIGRKYAIVAVSEGAKLDISGGGGSLVFQDMETDEFGHIRLGGIANKLAEQIEDEIGWESRSVVLGHLQRGGTPTAFDRFFSTRLGMAAIDEVASKNFGVVVCLQGTNIVPVPLGGDVLKQKTVPESYWEIVEQFLPKI